MYDVKINKYIGYIYKIYNDVNEKIYIGQTIQSPSKRFRQHCSLSKSGNENHYMILPRAINKYGVENFHMEVFEKFECNSKEDLQNILNQTEVEYIQKYNSLNPNGYNITKGGNFPSDAIYASVDQYSKNGKFIKSWESIVEAMQTLGLKGNNCHISDVCSGITNNKTAYGYVWRYKGEPFEKFGYKNKDYIQYFCFDLDGNFIKEYNSRSEIRNEYGSDIDQVLDDPNHQMYNRWWSSTQEFKYEGRLVTKNVDLYDKSGNFIKTFDSLISCAKFIGSKDSSSISAVCSGVKKTVCGYVVRYHGDSFNKFETKYCDKMMHFPIDVYNINKQYICTYDDMNDAINLDGLNSKKVKSIKQSIRRCCDGEIVHYYNYIFRYKGDDINKYNIGDIGCETSIDQYDQEGTFLTSWNSMSEASRQLGLPKNASNNISNCCNGKKRIAYGFVWRYSGEPLNKYRYQKLSKTS